jgi:hypothetical protein
MRLAAIFFLPLALSCTLPPPLNREAIPDLFSDFSSMDNLCSFKGFGDMRLTVRGERLSAKIDVLWRSDSNFSIVLNSRWGGLLASVTADSSGELAIRAGDSIVIKRSDENVSFNGILEYPLTFGEFLRIATGRILGGGILRESCDSLFVRGNKTFLVWREDSAKGRPFAVTATVDRKHFAVTDVIYDRSRSPCWRLSVSSIKGGVPEEFRFEDNYNNYFYLNYEKVIVRHGTHCRGERL